MNKPVPIVIALLFGSLVCVEPVRADGKADLEAARAAAKKLEAAGKYGEAAPLYEKALTLAVQEFGENHMTTAHVLNSLALVRHKQAKYAVAEPLYLRSLAIREKLRGKDHPDVTVVLINLGNLYSKQKQSSAAEPLLLRSLTILEKAHGKEHPDVAMVLNNLANLYTGQGKYAQAELLHKRSLAIREKIFGKENIEVANSLNNLGLLFDKQKKYADAEPLYQRSLAIKEKNLGKENVSVAIMLNSLAKLYSNQGKYAEAQPLFERCLAIREKVQGPEHPEVASALSALAGLYGTQGKLADAASLYQRELAIREKVLGKEHIDVADSLNSLALQYASLGKYADAEALYKRSLAIKEKILGKEHRAVAVTLNNLGLLYGTQGKYAAAEPVYQRSLAIKEKAFGPDHLDVAITLNNLANLAAAQGKLTEAVALLRRCLTIEENALGKEHPSVAKGLGNLANLFRQQGQFAEAEPLFQRCLAIFEKAHGNEHPDVALTLSNLAILYHVQGKYAEAEALFLRSVTIAEKIYGKEHPEVARPLGNLANLYKSQKKYSEAEPLYRRCLTIFETNFGKEHPAVARTLHNLIRLCIHQRRYADAVRWENSLRRNTRQFMLRELPGLSAREQQAFLELAEKARFASAMSLAFRRSKDAAVVEPSAAWLLNGKAIALEAQTIRGRLEREITDADGQAILREIKAVGAQEAALALKPKQAEALAKEREQLASRRRDLEKKLAQRSSTAAKLANPWVETAEVRKRIPADGVLIDIARFRIDRFDARTELYVVGPAHYVAWLIPPAGTGGVRLVDLGDAAKIDAAVQAARQTLENTVDRLEKRESEKKLEADAAEKLAVVAKLVFEPLKPHLGNAKNLILSPDGDLWLLPWAALPTGAGRFLIEDFSLRFVVTGRDLVDYDVGQKPKTNPALILADPDYNLTPAQVAEARPLLINPDNAIAALTRGASDDLRGIGRVKRLPGTVAEAKQAFDKLKTLTGQEPTLYQEALASETVVKTAKSPRVLVLATHGFFLKTQEVELKEDSTQSAAIDGQKKPAVLKDKEGKEVENPLLRCGLLLAGANKRSQAKQNEDDGILTGLEIVGLDLRGTQMVVLSACETAVGEVQTGEGVAGLRQAFQLAGAESVLATLWQISDSATGQLMNTFYDELAKGTERAEALTRAQRQFIKDRRERSGAAHPFFWASFTLTGK